MNIPSYKHTVRGEYRAILRDFRGRIKHDSGWRPNQVLSQGPIRMITGGVGFQTVALGDSDLPVSAAQTGLQGTYLGGVTQDYGFATSNWSTPPYWVASQCPAVFGTGVGTGTIREFVMCTFANATAAQNEASIRVVLDTPITKGASDHLTLEHRLYLYPDVANKSGVLSVGGENWDYEMGWYNIDEMLYGFVNDVSHNALIKLFTNGARVSFSNPVGNMLINGVMPVDIFSMPTGNTATSAFWDDLTTSAPAGGNPAYVQHSLISDVDASNGTFDMFKIWCNNYPYGAYDTGRVVSLTRSSDGAPFTKENTHYMSFTWRTYLDLYTP